MTTSINGSSNLLSSTLSKGSLADYHVATGLVVILTR